MFRFVLGLLGVALVLSVSYAVDHNETNVPVRGQILGGQWRAPDNSMAPSILRDSLYAVQTGKVPGYGNHFHLVVLTRHRGTVVAQRCLADTLWPEWHNVGDPDYRKISRANVVVHTPVANELLYMFISGAFYDQSDRLRVSDIKVGELLVADRRAKSPTHFYLGTDRHPLFEDLEMVHADSILGWIKPEDEHVPWAYVINGFYPGAPLYRPEIEERVIDREVGPFGASGTVTNLITDETVTISTQATVAKE